MFIGPYDLSLAHGYPPPSPDPHPDVEVIIQDILRRSHAKGKKWSVFSSKCSYGKRSLTVRWLVRYTAPQGPSLRSGFKKDLTWYVE